MRTPLLPALGVGEGVGIGNRGAFLYQTKSMTSATMSEALTGNQGSFRVSWPLYDFYILRHIAKGDNS